MEAPKGEVVEPTIVPIKKALNLNQKKQAADQKNNRPKRLNAQDKCYRGHTGEVTHGMNLRAEIKPAIPESYLQ